jgi:hypothetical protein
MDLYLYYRGFGEGVGAADQGGFLLVLRGFFTRDAAQDSLFPNGYVSGSFCKVIAGFESIIESKTKFVAYSLDLGLYPSYIQTCRVKNVEFHWDFWE